MANVGTERNLGKYKKLITPEMLLIIEGMCRDGAKDIDICEYLGISYNAFYRWISEHPEFDEAIKNGREVVDRKVENALLKRCLGFEYYEKKLIKVKGEIVREEKIKKYSPPDVTACCVWLNNRKPDQWKRNRDNYTINETDSGIQINIIKAKNNNEEEENAGTGKRKKTKTN